MVVTRRVPSPRSVRHLLQVASVSASVVGKRVRHVKHGRSASSRASPRRELLLESSNTVAADTDGVGPRKALPSPAGGPRRRLPKSFRTYPTWFAVFTPTFYCEHAQALYTKSHGTLSEPDPLIRAFCYIVQDTLYSLSSNVDAI